MTGYYIDHFEHFVVMIAKYGSSVIFDKIFCIKKVDHIYYGQIAGALGQSGNLELLNKFLLIKNPYFIVNKDWSINLHKSAIRGCYRGKSF